MIDACMIPARSGSQRLVRKNYLPFRGVSMVENTILKAVEAKSFRRIVLNTDDTQLEDLAMKYDIEIYIRDAELASSAATSDRVVLDFFERFDVSEVFWLNTVSPFTTVEDILFFRDRFVQGKARSAVSVNSKSVHATMNAKPVNFSIGTGFARTQDLSPITLYNYAIMAWSRESLPMLLDGVLFDDSTLEIETSFKSSILLKSEEDYSLIKQLQEVW